MDNIEICSKCNSLFYVTEHKLQMPGTKEREPISCPKCGETVREEMCNGWWSTRPLTDKELEEYNSKKRV